MILGDVTLKRCQKILWPVLLSLLVLSACDPDLEMIDRNISPILEESEMGEYIENASYTVIGESEENDKLLKIFLEAKSDLSQMKEIDLFLKISSLMDDIRHNDKPINCGTGVDCKVIEIEAVSGSDVYNLTNVKDELFYTKDSALLSVNDEPAKDKETMTEEYNKERKEEIKLQEEKDLKEGKVADIVVYNYMKKTYKRLLIGRTEYNPEILDPIVAESASKKFGITSAEAGSIYERIEMNKY